jgi:glycerol uptake facilitator-like aquaporin
MVLFTATLRTRKEFMSCQSLLWLRGRTVGALRAERQTLASADGTSYSAFHELLCSRVFIFIVLRSAQHPKISRFLQILRGIWPMPLPLLNHFALVLFAQHTRISTNSARYIGFCIIWVLY